MKKEEAKPEKKKQTQPKLMDFVNKQEEKKKQKSAGGKNEQK